MIYFRKLVLSAGLAAMLAALPGLLPSNIVGLGQTASAAKFNALGGVWSGGGKLRIAGGRSERLKCKGYYNPKGGGVRLGMAIRCASTSYKLELRSQLKVSGSRVTGSWEERNFNATGQIIGSSRPGRLALSASGSVSAGLFVTYGKKRQTVRLSGKFGSFRGLTLVLRRR